MSDPLVNDLEDEEFPPLPPPHSPGQGGRDEGDPFGDGEEDGDLSRLAEVPAAKRKGVKRPQPKLDSQRLISDRGLPALRTVFENVHFKGKGHEADDLRLLMQKMENWAHRLYPKLQFDDFIDRVEKLGSKKEVQTCLKRIRLDMPLTHEDYMGGEAAAPEPHAFGDPDPFSGATFPDDDLHRPVHSTPAPAAPPTPAPSALTPSPTPPSLTEEQRRRMELNRQRALERKLARQQQQQQQHTADSQTSADEPTSVSSTNVPDKSEDQGEAGDGLITEPEDDSSTKQQQQHSQPPHKDSEPPHKDSEPPAESESPPCEKQEETPPGQDPEPSGDGEDGE